jgi:hypothetical protein
MDKCHAFVTVRPGYIDWRLSTGQSGTDPKSPHQLGGTLALFLEYGVGSIELRYELED